MNLDLSSNTPLYLQIARGIEDDILDGILVEGERAYSQYKVAEEYSINPATAGKGIKALEQESILFKKRGLGMFVSPGAKDKIMEKRREVFIKEKINGLLNEARKLGIGSQEIITIINQWEKDL